MQHSDVLIVSDFDFTLTDSHHDIPDANRRAIETYLPLDALRGAMRAGYTEPWQLAEYFDLPEQDIKNALTYWSERQNVDFNRDIS